MSICWIIPLTINKKKLWIPEIQGEKPIIKGTRIPVALIYELIGLNYSITEILKECPHLDCDIILHLLKIGKDANENLINVNIDDL